VAPVNASANAQILLSVSLRINVSEDRAVYLLHQKVALHAGMEKTMIATGEQMRMTAQIAKPVAITDENAAKSVMDADHGAVEYIHHSSCVKFIIHGFTTTGSTTGGGGILAIMTAKMIAVDTRISGVHTFTDHNVLME
jgi:hypothetical protein